MMLLIGSIIFQTIFAGQIIAGIIYIVVGNPIQKSAGVMQVGYGILNLIMVFVLPRLFGG